MLAGPIPEQVDHRKLANQAALIDGSLPIQRFSRFGEMLVESEGEVYLRLEFSKGNFGSTRVTGSASTEVSLVCQNCMQQFRTMITCEFALRIVADESKVDHLDEEDDVVVYPDKVISLADLVEDDLILAMPMIPRHIEGECADTDFVPEEDIQPVVEAENTTYRPFADLAKVIDKQNTE